MKIGYTRIFKMSIMASSYYGEYYGELFTNALHEPSTWIVDTSSNIRRRRGAS